MAGAPEITRSTHFCTTRDNKRICYERSSVVAQTPFSHDIVVLCAHGNGFCKEMFNPVIEEIVESFERRSRDQAAAGARDTRDTKLVFASLDFRNHGDSSSHPFDRTDESLIDVGLAPMFDGAKCDVLAVVDDLECTGSMGTNVKLVGLAHSMGAACIALAALERPEAFASLTLYEPILTPPPPGHFAKGGKAPAAVKIANRTVKRKARFQSRREALDHFRRQSWDERVLDAYVTGALRNLPSGEVELKCHPVLESSMFLSSASGYPHLDHFKKLRVPVHILCGAESTVFASKETTQFLFKLMSSQFGNVRLTPIEGEDHMLPATRPAAFAEYFASDLLRNLLSTSKL